MLALEVDLRKAESVTMPRICQPINLAEERTLRSGEEKRDLADGLPSGEEAGDPGHLS